MQKLLGFFLLFSILALGGTNWVKNAQAQEPVKYYYDDGILPEHQNREAKQKVDGSSEFFNSTFPRKDFYPDYYKLYDYKPDNLFLVEGDDALLSEIKNNPYWKNVSLLNPNYGLNWDTGWNNGNEHSWFVFRILTSHSGQANVFYVWKGDEDSRITLYNLAKTNPKNIYIFSASFAPDNCTESIKGGVPPFTKNGNAIYDLSLLSNVRLNFGAANKGCQFNAGNSYSFLPNVVSVSSLDSPQSKIASFSNVILWNEQENRRVQTIFAPGESLPILDSKYQVTYISGTSFSTPQKSALDTLMEKLRLSLGITEITPQNQFFDLQISASDQITDTTRFPGTPIVANVLNGVDSLLSYEAFLTQKPVCHPKYSTLVANSPFDLGCGFPTSTHAQISIPNCNVNLTQAKELAAEYSVTCANVGPQTVMADNVAVGSLEVVGYEEGRQNLVELTQILSLGDTTIEFPYNSKDAVFSYSSNVNKNIASLYTQVILRNNSTTTKTVIINDTDFWFSCTSKDMGNGVSFRNLGWLNGSDGWVCNDESYGGFFHGYGNLGSANSSYSSNPIMDEGVTYIWMSKASSYVLPPQKAVTGTFAIEVSFSNSNSVFNLPKVTIDGEAFSEFSSPNLTFSETQPTATPTVPVATATPISGETPTPTATLVPGEPTPTATMPVSGETPTATATLVPGEPTPTATVMPGAARVYLPLIVR